MALYRPEREQTLKARQSVQGIYLFIASIDTHFFYVNTYSRIRMNMYLSTYRLSRIKFWLLFSPFSSLLFFFEAAGSTYVFLFSIEILTGVTRITKGRSRARSNSTYAPFFG